MRTTQTEAALAYALEGYLREFIALSPHSSMGCMDAASSSTPCSVDDRLIRYLELADHCAVGLMRLCTELQARILVRRHLTRRCLSRSQRLNFIDVPSEGQAVELTRHDLARAENLTVNQYRRELTKALEAVGHGLKLRAESKAA